ncbi:DNA-binding NarL/FixJ family response regulator [Thiogranum longum]|uniref:DNA-binding NarL/FixJ family response regulator n=1 Tax=Thiogranum longum TaxID=1537524 RepID=A0A4R1HGB2_9GAMM|nr:response regulator transcription factor [Thiogranum longum]TCK19310.1 DNA-binding NarL/FixJ family response regulator [Thiogranum longum]
MNNLYASSPDVTSIRYKTAPQDGKIKIFILGHKDFSIDSMARMVEDKGNNYMVSCVEPGDACMAKLVATEPDVLMIQKEVLKEPLERTIHGILGEYPNIRILVFGKDMDSDYLYRLVRAGVHGYINERMTGEHIERALASILEGNNWIERHIMERFIKTQQELDDVLETQFYEKISQLCDNLTKRETEILCEVMKGLAIKQIAEEVHLSHQGVKMHLAKLFKKFRVSNRNQLILAAFDEISPVEDLSMLLRNGLQKKLHASG